MSISSEAFRNALRHFPSGVAIVTIRSGEQIHGLTVSAFASVSTKPPLVMIAVDHQHSAYPLIEADQATFAANILAYDQINMSNRFAWIKDEDRFKKGDWETAVTGAPILIDSLAWLDCTIKSRLDAGTHTIYVGEVQASGVQRAEQPPLIYWNRGYRHLDIRDPGEDETV